MRTFVDATKQLRKVGCSNATGDSLRAMYAEIIRGIHGGEAEKYYGYLQRATDDREILRLGLALARDRAKAWDVLMGTAGGEEIVCPS